MNYSIKYLEEISGIKAHTIRIWEQRYKLLKPKRTDTNIRYYDDNQLRKILNVTTLLNSGYKISHIGDMSDIQITKLLKEHLDTTNDISGTYHHFTNELIISSLNFDKASFENNFNLCVLKFGFSATVENILYPTLNRIGILWLSEELNPSQEHFISNLIKQKLYSAIDGLSEPKKHNTTCILFLPENEHHEIGLLYFNYLLIKSGIKTIYLGENVPIENVQQAEGIIKPTHLIFFLTKSKTKEHTQKYLTSISKKFSKKNILIAGNPSIFEHIRMPKNIELVNSPEVAKKYFKLN
jgi:DNA-binding transcriptional MerR regulator